METLPDFLKNITRRYGEAPALLHRPGGEVETWSYSELWRRSVRAANLLASQSIGRGDRVVLWGPNSPYWVAGYFGALMLGATVVPLDVHSGQEFIDRVIEQTEPKLALVAEGVASDSLSVPLFPLEQVASGEETEIKGTDGNLSTDDLAVIVFTSGSTGVPKGVVLTHGNIRSNMESADKAIAETPYVRLLSLLPLSHMFEQTVGLLIPLLRGGSIFYPASLQPNVLFKDLAEQRVTYILLVPQVLQLFMNAIEREVARQHRERPWRYMMRAAGYLPLSARRLLFKQVHQRLGGHIRFLVSGGAPLDPDLLRKWTLLGIPILRGYGATEAAPVISATSLRDPDPDSVGKPIPGLDLRIASDDEVLIQGPSVTAGYWRNPEATAEAFEDGWYKTGDLGRLDEQGRLHLFGRKKNLIVLSNGLNVYPEDIEAVLQKTEGVSDAVVLGKPSPRGAEVHAVLLMEESGKDPKDAVREANRQLAPHQQIHGFTVWPDEDFPRTHTLKVNRPVVTRAVLESGEGEQPGNTD